MHFAVDLDAQPVSYADVLRAWPDDAGFRSLFNAQLADAPYTAFRWETPPVTEATISRPFEFVLLGRKKGTGVICRNGPLGASHK
jgi:hypothetical protein